MTLQRRPPSAARAEVEAWISWPGAASRRARSWRPLRSGICTCSPVEGERPQLAVRPEGVAAPPGAAPSGAAPLAVALRPQLRRHEPDQLGQAGGHRRAYLGIEVVAERVDLGGLQRRHRAGTRVAVRARQHARGQLAPAAAREQQRRRAQRVPGLRVVLRSRRSARSPRRNRLGRLLVAPSLAASLPSWRRLLPTVSEYYVTLARRGSRGSTPRRARARRSRSCR